MSYQENLLAWYEVVHRPLPWRETSDPYKIWISEVMLQQTQVVTVIDYYKRFLKVFPTIQDLAESDEEVVLKLWEGLGYYSRARRLRLCAKEVMEKHGGQFPENYEKVLSLSGIGPYTAGAILSIAYNMSVPAVDGNVMRVISRHFKIESDISKPSTRKVFEEKVTTLLPEDRRHFNQALMELGATVCTPRNPKCECCPVRVTCEAERLGIQDRLPVKTKKVKKVKKQMKLAYVKSEDKVLITKRPDDGLLGGLWGFPIVEADEELEWELKDAYDLEVNFSGIKSTAQHVFTHLIWDMTLMAFETQDQRVVDYPIVHWVAESELENYAFPTAFKKLL